MLKSYLLHSKTSNTGDNNFNKLKIAKAVIAFAIFFIHNLIRTEAQINGAEFQKSIENLLSEGQVSSAIDAIKSKQATAKNKSQRILYQDLLDEVVNVFLSEDTQKKFYQAESQKYENYDKAIELLNELRKQEPYNEKILTELAWNHLYVNNCDSAAEPLELALQRNPMGYRARILQLSLDYCTKKMEAAKFQALLKTPNIPATDELAIRLMLIQSEMLAADTTKIGKLFQKERKWLLAEVSKNADYPPLLYVLMLMPKEILKDSQDWVELYLSNCQNQKAKVLRKYENFPLLCMDLPKVLALKKNQ